MSVKRSESGEVLCRSHDHFYVPRRCLGWVLVGGTVVAGTKRTGKPSVSRWWSPLSMRSTNHSSSTSNHKVSYVLTEGTLKHADCSPHCRELVAWTAIAMASFLYHPYLDTYINITCARRTSSCHWTMSTWCCLECVLRRRLLPIQSGKNERHW